MLAAILRRKIEIRFQQNIRYSRDCDTLSDAIYMQCKGRISPSTLKRMFGFLKWTEPRRFTMDIIANYIGYETYDELLNEILDGKPKKEQRIESIECSGLRRGAKFRVRFGNIAFIEAEYTGSNKFRLLHHEKSGLITGDVLEIRKVELHVPLLVNRIKRNELTLTGMILGRVTGVTEIKKI